MAKPNPQFNTPLSPNQINAELPLYPIYGVTPDNKYTPISIDENGQLSIGSVTITGPVTISDVVIKGVDPNNSNVTEDISVFNLGSGNGYAMRSTLFDGGNHLTINDDGSINTTITGSAGVIPVSIDHNLDSVSIYGTDGTADRFIKTDISGNLQVGIVGTPTVSVSNFPAVQPVSAVSLPLPTNAAEETGGNLDAINSGLQTLNSLIPSVYDYIALTYTGSDLTAAIFKNGGSGGMVVSTLTLAYSGGNLVSVTKS